MPSPTTPAEHPPDLLPSPEEAPVLDLEVIAQFLGLHEDTVRARIKDGSLPSIRLGRRLFVPNRPFRRIVGLED